MKTILITGASGGIGKAIACKLAERKHNLLLVARSEGKLKDQCAALSSKYGIKADFIAIDLASPNSAFIVFQETQRLGLQIDMLINNAGVGSGGEFSKLKLGSELALLQLNVSTLVALTHYFLPQMQERKRGTIINVASLASYIPIPYMATYAASKAFVRSFTQAITQECEPYGINVLLFSPGLTKTNFNEAAGLGNDIAIALNSDYSNSSSQTPEEVADEMLTAIDNGKHAVVSGKVNRLAANLTALVPDSFIARSFAKMYRKRSHNNVDLIMEQPDEKRHPNHTS